MKHKRRTLLKIGGGAGLCALLVGTGIAKPGTASAATANPAFDAKTSKEALEALGAGNAAESADIIMRAPEIAENGAVVPVAAESKIAATQSIAIVVDKNPFPLAAVFDIPEGTAPAVNTRVKMAETSDVYVLVKADGKYYSTRKEIKVTLGGCGG